jgi:hypothetical protein
MAIAPGQSKNKKTSIVEWSKLRFWLTERYHLISLKDKSLIRSVVGEC